MQYQGYSTKNLHQGDVRITGDLQVDGTLIIDELKVNELTVDGYKLPTSKGNPGDVIVASGDGSTSEWVPAFEGNARIWQNMFTMTVPEPARKTTITRLDQSGIGSRKLERDQFPVGSAVRAYAKGQFTVTNPVPGQFASFKIYLGLQINTEVGQEFNQFVWGGEVNRNVVSFFQPFTGGHWEVEFYFTRISETEIQVNSTSINVYDIVGNPLIPTTLGASFYNIEDVPPIPELPFIFPVDPSDEYFIFGIRQLDSSSQNASCILKTEVYTIDLCSSESKIIASSANLTTDHTLLSNLTLGDAGHSQFALLAGRDGGQILSGGITPLHDLKLKSHSIGLDNVIIKDLNTEFKKDIDMDNNNISNANLISNTDGSIQYNTHSYGLEITTQNSKSLNVVSALDAKLSATNVLDIASGSVINLYNGLATQMTIDGSEIGANIPVNMNSNNITNAKDIIDASTNNKIDMATGGFLNSLELSSADEVKLLNTTSNNFVSASSGGVNIASSVGSLNISHATQGNTIELNDGSLLGGLSIKSNSVGVLIQENSSTNNLGVSSGSVGMLCNSGQLNIRSTDAGNDLTIAKQNGGNIELDVQSGGGLVIINNSNLDMNNNSIVNASNLGVLSINNLTPVGGLYASTSAGTLIDNTTLQSLTPASSVGSLSVPANGFSVGDCFHLVITGDCVFTNNDEIQITLKQNGNILAQTPVFNLEDANSGDNVFEIEADFNIRSVGATGSIHTSFEFTYNKDSLDSKDFRGTRSNDTQTIDTTIPSTLDVEFQFISKNASSSIQTQLFRLQKVF